MSRILPAALATAVIILLSAAPAMAQGPEVPVTVGADFFSQYVSRGEVVMDRAAAQPWASVELTGSGLSLELWSSFAADEREITDAADEINVIASYGGSFVPDGPLGYAIGYVQYAWPNALAEEKHSEEAFAGLSFDHLVAPALTVYRDFGLVDGTYVEAALAPTFELPHPTVGSVSVSASLGMSDIGQDFGFQDFTLGASLGLSVGWMSISPAVGWTVGSEAINPDDTAFWSGVSISAGS